MIAQIIPARRLPRLRQIKAGLPRSIEYFSYSVPTLWQDKIQVGQIAEINFRNKNILGLIVGITKQKKFKYPLKPINKILYPTPLVTHKQLKLIDFVSNYYGVAKSIIVKSLLPDVPKRNKDIKALKHENIKALLAHPRCPHRGAAGEDTSGEWTNAFGRKTKKQEKGGVETLFWYQDEKELWQMLTEKIKTNNERQILILVPEIELIDKLVEKLALAEEKIVRIHSDQSKTEFFSAYLEILSGAPKIILGTKISVLLPFKSLGTIIIYQEENWNHKQSDINPRYDARTVAGWLAREHGCKLILTTAAPRVETYYHKNTKTQKHKNTGSTKTQKIPVKIINLKQERLKGNYGVLSNELIGKIKEKLAVHEKIFIFHNRKGLAQFVSCLDCGFVFKCPDCQISLTYHITDKKLFCHHCGFSIDIPPLCSACQGPNIKFKGQGIERVKLELQKELSAVEILMMEKTSYSLKHENIKALLAHPRCLTEGTAGEDTSGEQADTLGRKTSKQINNEDIKQYNIVIGTEFVLNKLNFNDFGLIAFTNFDQLLNQSDFRSAEWAYQLFYEIKSAAPLAEFFIQTHNPENSVIKSIIRNEPNIFYEEELKNRKDLDYPPFAKIIKLTYQDKNEKIILAKTKKVISELKNKHSDIEVNGPLENWPKKIRGKFRYHIILKIKPDFALKKIIKLIPNDFVIDVEPERLV